MKAIESSPNDVCFRHSRANFNMTRSINQLTLAHALVYLTLVAGSAALGGTTLFFWQRASAEQLRSNAMIEQVQEMRGTLYRQIKEVFDAVFLQDRQAVSEYRQYEIRIDEQLRALQTLALDSERSVVAGLAEAYRAVKAQSDELLTSGSTLPLAERQKLFDTDLELGGFGAYELAFENIERLVEIQKAESQRHLAMLNRLAPLLLALPILLAIGLLVYSRFFLQRAIVRPLVAAQRATAMISRGDLDQHVPERGAAELVLLAQSVNRMAADLSHSRAALLRAEKQATLAALVPVVAHNIRNPLASIRATAQIIVDPAQPAELREGLAGIIATADRLDRWTHALLSYLHPLQPQRVPCHIPQLVDDVLKLVQARLDEKQISVDREGWAQPSVLLDPQLMEQALHGLLVNALDASPHRGRLRLALTSDTEKLELTIADQGPGLRFTPVASGLGPGPSDKRYGTGLGIPFAMKVIDVHGGKITFSVPSAPTSGAGSAGTEVCISMPLKKLQESNG